MISHFIPETRGFALKRKLLRFAGAKVGKNVRVCSSAFIAGTGNLEIGSNTWIGHGVMLLATSNLIIEKNVDVAPRVLITTGTHMVGGDLYRAAGSGQSKDVYIKRGAWICANATILPGVIVGEMSVVAAGAVVCRDVDNNCIFAGVPAKLIKEIKYGK